MNIKKILFSIAITTASFSSYATMVTSNGLCDPSTVQITVIETNPGGDAVTGMSYPIDSTKCLGYVTNPHNDWGNSPNPNNGLLGEGLLNGELNKDGYFIPGDYFLTNPNDSLVDLDGDDDFTDPGWIRLGGVDDIEDNDVQLNFEYDSINGYNIGQVINMQFSMNGTWSLSVDPSAIPFATNALGRPTVFDHLAFVMKGPNSGSSTSGWAVYDFNFYDLIDSGLNISLGDTAYSFEGTWDSSTIFGGQRLSHFSVWAHDPPGVSVDEPALLGLFALGLALVGFRRKSRNA
ncbi:hypothetical protein QTP81_01245 [Alteromonas sp. ASW11-36]|uniref:PEP-CTERM sorting domain-containing protein n=1 Tax=Alteromonas arenosi TaxID=3055817 RepID=A0ABT7SUM5_9ALTE|nr:hypothetical protein [Alteromonas sp. ASW11-36]MDM7859229.1 hypothetical protein [Alteromonas sp. ASW11-36]